MISPLFLFRVHVLYNLLPGSVEGKLICNAWIDRLWASRRACYPIKSHKKKSGDDGDDVVVVDDDDVDDNDNDNGVDWEILPLSWEVW